jgi:serine/threonine protein kinase/Tfp pilus assembly protein PilF
MIDKTFEHYKILKRLGKGGMGEVFLAEDKSLQRKVALKFLSPELQKDESAHKRFLREAQTAAAIDHPYICHINEIGETEGKEFIVMEYVEGQTLKERLEQGPLTLDEAQKIALEIVEALEEAHNKGIIHRDLKPANIMLTAKGHSKVMDFGLAKQLSPSSDAISDAETVSDLTRAGAIVGTPDYMSPEQLRGIAADVRSDLFSFGVLYFEMLMGFHPYKQISSLETISDVLSDAPTPLLKAKRRIPKQTREILSKLLAKEPSQRYQSAHELHLDLSKSRQEKQAGISGVRFLRPIRISIICIVLILIIAPLTWWVRDNYFLSPRAALAFQERDWILIADLENLTGDDEFNALKTAVTVGIQQSPYVNVFPPGRIEEALQRMRQESTAKLDEELACELAEREGIKAVLVCSVGEIGGVYSLTAKLVQPNKRKIVFSESATTDEKNQVIGMFGLLVRVVRKSLGESLRSIESRSLPLPLATTESLEALKIYTEGVRSSDMKTGIEMLKEAVELDPEFALAHAAMGQHYYIEGERVLGEEQFEKALSLIDRLTYREKLWIRALVEDWRGNSDLAVEHYKVYLNQFPDDSFGWFRLGWLYMARLSEFDKGLNAFQKAAGIDTKEASNYTNIATCYLGLQQYEKAIEYYEKGFELRPEFITGDYINDEYGFTLVRMGQLQKARDVFNQMLASEEVWKKARGYRSIALLNMYQGKLSEAASNLKQAVSINRSDDRRTSEYRDRMYLAEVYRLQGRTSEFTSELEAEERMLSESQYAPSWISKLAKIYARMGKLEEASQLYAEIISQADNVTALSGIDRSENRDQSDIALIEGEIALAKGNIADAIESFEVSLHWEPKNTYLLESLATAHRRAGQLKEAAEKYEEIISEFRLGNEEQAIWILAHNELGNIYRDLGNVEKAREYYDKFLNIWKEADEDIPILQEARADLMKLQP